MRGGFSPSLVLGLPAEVLLRDLSTRKRLFDEFKAKNKDEELQYIDWGREESAQPDGLKCNSPCNMVVLEGQFHMNQEIDLKPQCTVV